MAKAEQNTTPSKAGRPVKYTESLIEKIRVKFEKYIQDTDIPIIAEFAYKNDIPRRKLYDLNELKHTIKKCIDKKEANLEKNSFDKNKFTPGLIFGLKQLGHSDNPIVRSENDNENKNYLTQPKDINLNTFRVIRAIRKGKRLIVCRGGTRSGKSYGLAQLALDGLFSKEYAGIDLKGDLGLYSQSLPHLKGTLLEDIYKVLSERDLQEDVDYKHHKTDHYFEFDGLKMWYGSINNLKEAAKVKGKGLSVIFLNEADAIPYNAFQQLYMRGKENLIIVLDFNPDDEDVWINEEIEKTDKYKNVEVIVSTFEDNDFISEEEKDRIRNLENIDKQLWEIYGKGQYGTIEGKVYPNWDMYKELPTGDLLKFYGEDLGFVKSRDAVLEVNWLRGTRDIYIKSRLYQTGIEIPDLLNILKTIVTDDEIVFADCSDRRLLSLIKNSACKNLLRPKKGRAKMVKYVRGFRIHIHEDDIDTRKEIGSYKFIKDPKTGKFTNEPVKFMDDLMDALGYAIIGLIEIIFVQSKIKLGDLK